MDKNNNVASLRKGAKITQDQLSQRVGIDQSYLVRIEQGKPMSVHTAYKLAQELGVSVDVILFTIKK